MARIPDEVVERLKREVSVSRLAEARGIALKKHGENLIGLCPFHDDREPSLVVTPSKNLWHCLGACQAGGSVIDWVMRSESCSFTAAVQMLEREHIPSLVAAPEERRGRTTSAKLEEIAEPDEPDHVVCERVVAHYHATLKNNGEAQAYLGKRRIEYQEAIEHFKLGFSNRTLGYRIASAQVKAGAAVRAQLQRLGIYRESGHEHFNGSLTIPIFDEEGGLAQMYGRKVRDDLRPGTAKHLYLPRPHTAVWNVAALTSSKDVILCESLIDALTFWCAGFVNVITSYGVEGFTKSHLAALKVHGTQRVLIAYDRDEAGNKAAVKLAPELAAAGLEVYRVLFPHGMDANEYALRVKPAKKSLETALRAANWLAGTRSVLVPGTVVDEHAKATVIAEQEEAQDETVAPAAIEACGEIASERIEHASTPMLENIPPLAAHAEAEARREDAASAPAPSALQPASPPSPSRAATITAEVKDGEVSFQFGPRTWRVRGLEKNTSLSSIKVHVRVSLGTLFFSDTLDVLSARARGAFLKQAREELEQEERALKTDLGKVILKLEELLDSALRAKLEPVKKGHEMSESEKAEALSLLKDPKLLERVVRDFERCGVVGEETNKLVGYLAAVSRKLESPLAVVIQSSSAAGKSSLMDAVLRFVPEEEQVSYSAMTGQSLFYMGNSDLQHKVLAIAEEQGATNASYALKILQSSGELTIASTGKDPATGRLVTHEYRVTGPVMVMLTTTSIEIDEELLNRCMVLTVDEGREQTRAIQRLQREGRTLAGLIAKQQRGQLMALHQNAQRLLRPLHVVNPYATELSFSDHATRTRRDHAKYLTLIDAIALLHQYQRPVKTAQVGGGTLRYIEVTREDLGVAEQLAGQVLSRSLDELSPQTRALYELAHGLIVKLSVARGMEPGDVRFSQRELRDHASWSATQVKVQLRRLVELEYVTVHGHKDHRQRLLYGVSSGYDANRSALSANRSEPGPREAGPVLMRDSEPKRALVRERANTESGPSVRAMSYAHDAAE